jgi:tetratricopeptide (TPR) repeat protein
MMDFPDRTETIAQQLHQQAETDYQHQNFEAAIAACQQALTYKPDWAEAYHTLAMAYHASGDRVQALNCYDRTLELDPNDARAYANRASLYAEQQNWQLAQTGYQTALQLQLDAPTLWRNLAQVQENLALREAATESWYQAIVRDPDWATADVYTKLGRRLVQQQRGDWAVEIYRLAIARYPEMALLNGALADVLQTMGQYPEAIAAYRQAIAIESDEPLFYRQLGKALQEGGWLQEALDLYRQVLRFDRSVVDDSDRERYRTHYRDNLMALGEALERQDCLDAAIACYTAAIRFAPDDLLPYDRLRYALLSPQQKQTVVAFYRDVLQSSTLNAIASGLLYRNLGYTLSLQNCVDEAIASYQQASYYQTLSWNEELTQTQWQTNLSRSPDFLIIGSHKGGTTSLFHYLSKHPQVLPTVNKEIDFFSFYFNRGNAWYLSHFPKLPNALDFLVGEASPSYLNFPDVPQRVAQLLPNTKLIVLLRNPINRAISHYYHWVRQYGEKRTLAQAIDAEIERLDHASEVDLIAGKYWSHEGYVSRSLYVYDLQRWLQFFPREQFLFLSSEAFYEQPESCLNQVFEFLGISPHGIDSYPKLNKGDYHPVDEGIRQTLANFFQPHDRKLEQIVS